MLENRELIYKHLGECMELTDRHLEKIREVARGVGYGSVTINISANSNKLDLSVNNRIWEEEEKKPQTAKVIRTKIKT